MGENNPLAPYLLSPPTRSKVDHIHDVSKHPNVRAAGNREKKQARYRKNCFAQPLGCMVGNGMSDLMGQNNSQTIFITTNIQYPTSIRLACAEQCVFPMFSPKPLLPSPRPPPFLPYAPSERSSITNYGTYLNTKILPLPPISKERGGGEPQNYSFRG